MSISTALKSLAPIAKRGVCLVKAKSPTILIASGIASGIAATIIAVKRHAIAQEAKKQFDDDIRNIDTCHASGYVNVENDDGSVTAVDYTEETYRKDLRLVYTNKINAYIRAYAPSVALTALSVTCILVSHGIMRRRNTALTAAVASVSEAFRKYRSNVKKEYGEEADYNMRHGLITKAEKVKEVDPETGKTKTVTKVTKTKRDDGLPWRSDYARCYEAGCRNWTKDANTNRLTLLGFQAFANQKLKENGFLYLNEVYDMLGIDQTMAGHEMGWIYTKEENQHGDNYVDFGFDKAWDFNSGLENSVWLDFNVDDLPITDRIRWRIK